jgi:glycosyltransferase involved in cell wall biosynthesis
MRCHETLPPGKLLEVLATYDFGWAGFNAALNGPHLDTALPNKAFEYVGCGLPILTLGHRALARLVTEEGVGVSLDSLDDVDARLRELDVARLRRRAAEARARFTVEANVGRLVELYEAVA